MLQAECYIHLTALTGRENNLDATLRCVKHEDIGFAKIKRATCDFDERSRFVIDIAHNLFFYCSPCKATPEWER